MRDELLEAISQYLKGGIAKHKANIKRLFSGQEPKISFLKNKNNV